MHHYSTVTCETMGATPQQRDVWKYAVPKETIKHDFLMDGILSFAAVHYAHLNPPSSGINSTFYITAAMQYQNSGLQGYRAALSSVTRDNFEAVFAFSIILTILGFAMPSGLSASSAQLVSSPTTSLSCIFELLKGVKLTIEDYAEAIRIGMFSPLFNSADQGHAPPAQLSTVLPMAESEAAMERLRHRAEFVARYVGSEMRQVYLSSIDSLETAFQEVSATKTFNIAIAWPVMASSSSRMIELFNHGDPMALLLWAHYGVLTLCFHDQWWGEGFGVRLVEDLSRRLHELDPEWDSWTEWARLHASRLQSISAQSRVSQSGFH
ncbi:fungal specific transcription factor domain-containing protein [Microdochium nivale]|nr:fungal specific transcription factor domain-containing protein [Microdochium nivale]